MILFGFGSNTNNLVVILNEKFAQSQALIRLQHKTIYKVFASFLYKEIIYISLANSNKYVFLKI